MTDHPEGGTNARPLNDTIAGTGPGIADDALAPGEDNLPEAPSDEEVARAAKALGAPIPPSEGESVSAGPAPYGTARTSATGDGPAPN